MARKYIKFSDGSFLIFSDTLQHAEMLDRIGSRCGCPRSAGFVGCLRDGRPHCYGASIGLDLESAPTDTEELRQWLCIG